MLIMVLLSGALVATLWLSTAAAADSYRMEHAREINRDLTEHSEQLGRDVASMETAPELARRAVELGMVPAGDPARLVVGSDGAVAVVGKPKAATAPATEQPAHAQVPTPAQLAANGGTPAQPEAAQPAVIPAGSDVPAPSAGSDEPAGSDVPAQPAGSDVPAQPAVGPGGAG
jgi:hypothetical protein